MKNAMRKTVAVLTAMIVSILAGQTALAAGIPESTTAALPPVIHGVTGNFGFWFGIILFICGAAVAGAMIFLKLNRDEGQG